MLPASAVFLVLTVSLTEPDLRRLDALWPDIEAAPDRGPRRDLLVERVASWYAGRQRCEAARRGPLRVLPARSARRATRPASTTLIVETIATAVGAQQAALALYDEAAGQPRHRRHPRLPGGAGGGPAHRARAPASSARCSSRASRCWCRTPERERPQPRRPRYRTGSFMAVPLFTDGQALGVLTLADRSDLAAVHRGRTSRVARAMAAPAALGLATARLAGQARRPGARGRGGSR